MKATTWVPGDPLPGAVVTTRFHDILAFEDIDRFLSEPFVWRAAPLSEWEMAQWMAYGAEPDDDDDGDD